MLRMLRRFLRPALAFVTALSAGCGSAERSVLVKDPAPTESGSPSPARPVPGPSRDTSAAGVDVNPPPKSDAIFRVQVAKDGAVSIEGQRLSEPRELADRVRTSAKVRPDLSVLVLGERETPYGYILTAIDAIRHGGVHRISFAQDTAPSTGPLAAPRPKSVPTLEAGSSWKCSIQGGVKDLEKLSAFVAIYVGPDGVPQTVDILEDPGQGLGESAKRCALAQKFKPALDASGKPTVGVSKVRVSFQSEP
jgi:biopolymer transport protein ExbD